MKNIGFKITLLVFFLSILLGYYLDLPLVDNLIRSFVVYVVFSVLFLGASLAFNHLSLAILKESRKNKGKQNNQNLNNATANISN